MKVNIINLKDVVVDDIVRLLKKESFVMAIPTDTVYALCCNANDETVVKKIYDLKNREKDKPISLFIKSIDELNKYIDCNNSRGEFYEPHNSRGAALQAHCRGEALRARNINELLKQHWPGALTVIFKKKKNIYDYLTSSKDTIGIRIPNNKLLLDILDKADFPLAQTSCNMSHEKELKNATEIYKKFGDNIDLIIETEKDLVGKASTIISVEEENIKILRQGDIIL